MLDLTSGGVTPTIVTIDAHKHLGTDKGVSTVVGTPGTLAVLDGRVAVGARPTRGALVRAVADVMLVGVRGYVNKYRALAAAVDAALAELVGAGLEVVHAEHRAPGSTVFALYCPGSVLTRRIKKRGHKVAPLFHLHPHDASKCQYGFSLSATPHALREVAPGLSALDVFVRDCVALAPDLALRGPFNQNSLAACLLNGGDPDPWLLARLWTPGPGRAVITATLRRLFSLLLDAGKVKSDKRPKPLADLAGRFAVGAAAAAALAAVALRRARLSR